MYSYIYDSQTGGLLLQGFGTDFSAEPRPVYAPELNLLGFNKYCSYDNHCQEPFMWAESNNYYYRGRKVAQLKGGSLYTPPLLEIIEAPEAQGDPLQAIDIAAMLSKNQEIMESLAQKAIKDIYNTYVAYKSLVNAFYVAFSGGKDSVAVLDLVKRALPHQAFMVLFANTDMEFPTTLSLVEQTRQMCEEERISFYEARAQFPALQSWKLFGPPGRRLRWCCTVHKTAPVINKLAQLVGQEHLHSMMITGVRAQESPMRSNYENLSLGKKLPGQYSFHPLLHWSSAEIYLYLLMRRCLINEAYKLGFSRVGCIMCPNSAKKHDYIKRSCFPELVEKYCQLICQTSSKDLSGTNRALFLESGAWKTRLTGRELTFSEQERYQFKETPDYYVFTVANLHNDWQVWYRAMGQRQELANSCQLEYRGVWRNCVIRKRQEISEFYIENKGRDKNATEFLSLFKSVLIKSQYCCRCLVCLAECPNRYISLHDGRWEISEQCDQCGACLRMQNGCVLYNSIKGSQAIMNVKGINRYFNLGVKSEWISNYLQDEQYDPGNKRKDAMFSFLNDAGLTSKRKLTEFGTFVQKRGLDEDYIWALMICNAVYTSIFGWYVKNIPFNKAYSHDDLEAAIGQGNSDKAKGELWNSLKVILDTTRQYQRIGFGLPNVEEKKNTNGEIRKTLVSITRAPWRTPDPRVVLYALYKFAEHCDHYYQFTLTRLLNHAIASEGVSPSLIFGLNELTMKKLLAGLSDNYPQFINVSFSLDLDTITLAEDKTALEVLTLFN